MPSDQVDLEEYRRLEAALYAVKRHLERARSLEDCRAGLAAEGLTEDAIKSIVKPPVDADLHLHSNYSDGNLPPRKLVWLARLMGLKAIALTDHDHMGGIAEAAHAGERLGVTVLAGLEFNTGRSGCELLCYFPNTAAFLSFLASSLSEPLRRYLKAIQDRIHGQTLAIIPSVNSFLRQQGVAERDSVTVAELADWFSGQEPFYPGTVAVLGLKRLTPERRKQLCIFDPREFNTRVCTPALKALPRTESGSEPSLDAVFGHIAEIRWAGVRCVSALAHPRELETKGRMRREDVRPFVQELVKRYGLDGLEVNNSRDSAEDTAHWLRMADELDAATNRRLVRFSFSSDFHVLAPGTATGEITMAYGVLDERPGHRRGNLRPCTTLTGLLAAISAAAH
ncbi:MAG: PHP domain-containing protein [Planctomycetes bacterium]|nr:PHP domain-containing protein [Planctomycetota bacterium]